MALIKCKDCGKEFSTDAKVCPYCGAKKPRRSLTTREWVLIILLTLIGFAMPDYEKKSTAQEPPKTPQEIESENMENAVQHLKDPDNTILSSSMNIANESYNHENYKKAAKYYLDACNHKEAQGCFEYGFLLDAGRGVKENSKTAYKYYMKSCDLGHRGGCSFVGLMYRDGRGVDKNIDLAKAFLQRSCKMGNYVACIQFQDIK